MAHAVEAYGPAILFLTIVLESAGLPLPGETGLIAAGVLASQGHLNIASVIVLAAIAAIVGDGIGYWSGRLGGRHLLHRWPRVARYAARVIPPAERFFERHGGKTVFLARFVTGLRVAGAWIAGVTRMNWWRFLCWNAAGGIAWAAGIGLIAYVLGRTAADLLGQYSLIVGAVADAAVALAGVHVLRCHARRQHQAVPVRL